MWPGRRGSHDQRPRRRHARIAVIGERGIEIGQQPHPQLQDIPARRFGPLPVVHELAAVVQVLVDLLPDGVFQVPAVDLRDRGEDARFQAAVEFLERRGVADFRAPEGAAEAGGEDGPDELAVVVGVGVEGEGQRGRQGAAGTDQPEGPLVAAAIHALERPLIQRAEQHVHLFAVQAGGEEACSGKDQGSIRTADGRTRRA